ncbi:gamma-glutamylcyclotransferase [Paenibacillus sp. NPDC058071]|uniref:gamma-glutamylcyclotransferase family protein n=1 Tax=Paenibacillus sp. NPDC058071 TaxID=3346326 RepID=UPI0036DDFBA6
MSDGSGITKAAAPFIRIFIYGTLLPGQSNHRLAAAYMEGSVPGRIAGRLVDVRDYPAAVLDEQAMKQRSTIRGLWIQVTREGLAEMDKLEEFFGIEEKNDYERVWTCDCESPGRSGWVYVWPNDRNYPAIVGDSWTVYFTEKEK